MVEPTVITLPPSRNWERRCVRGHTLDTVAPLRMIQVMTQHGSAPNPGRLGVFICTVGGSGDSPRPDHRKRRNDAATPRRDAATMCSLTRTAGRIHNMLFVTSECRTDFCVRKDLLLLILHCCRRVTVFHRMIRKKNNVRASSFIKGDRIKNCFYLV